MRNQQYDSNNLSSSQQTTPRPSTDTVRNTTTTTTNGIDRSIDMDTYDAVVESAIEIPTDMLPHLLATAHAVNMSRQRSRSSSSTTMSRRQPSAASAASAATSSTSDGSSSPAQKPDEKLVIEEAPTVEVASEVEMSRVRAARVEYTNHGKTRMPPSWLRPTGRK